MEKRQGRGLRAMSLAFIESPHPFIKQQDSSLPLIFTISDVLYFFVSNVVSKLKTFGFAFFI